MIDAYSSLEAFRLIPSNHLTAFTVSTIHTKISSWAFSTLFFQQAIVASQGIVLLGSNSAYRSISKY
jgi:hypothetical protein